MANVCVSSLREVLDSVLTFSKLANSEVSSSNAMIAPPTTTADLKSIVVAVVQSVWAGARFKRSAREAAAEYSALQAPTTPLGSPGKVDLILEYNLPPGTTAQVDVGALTRVLSNLIGNAHKHTSNGSIVVVVAAILQSVIEGTTQVHIDVADTGSSFFTPPSILLFRLPLRYAFPFSCCVEVLSTDVPPPSKGRGMSADFVKNRLFLSFSQESPFNQGNGLGVTICDTLVRNMGGSLTYSSVLDVGTTASVALPLRLIPPRSDSHPARPPLTGIPLANSPTETAYRPQIRRVLSDEFSAFLDVKPSSVESILAPLLRPPSPSPILKLLATRPGLPYTPPLTPPALPAAVCVAVDSPGPFTVLVADDNLIARRVLVRLLPFPFPSHPSVSQLCSPSPFIDDLPQNAQNRLPRGGRRRTSCRALQSATFVVLGGHSMPVMDGIEASRKMREIEAEKGWEPARIVRSPFFFTSRGAF